ncbi:dephospho-CoA kinase CoaE [Methyloglobulus morosus KoM1]|uniref:Dephospho-CoA kinase n=1 Tax=Methyloglobulus morosus KoM1 TaxID=1116472 RepID=V5BHP6_9GAMM|nr:dephospho-CoA kinase [Methyloglobulus morosus]ESS72830.1 dephospho-CoA kinase CoaE [Methyloglobulus morosus KoM1]
MFKVGLTGGIGCGKSTVSKLFTELNVPVIDADEIAHQLVEPGQPALLEIGNVFGDKVFNPDGSLDRSHLRDIIFSDPTKKQALEAILHPRIFIDMQERINRLESPYCIASIPLLFEIHRTQFVDRILVVDCLIERQIARVKQRNGWPDARIRSIIHSQVNREFRLNHADDVIDNSDIPYSKLAEHVKKLHNLYLSISASGQTRS